MVTMAIPFIVTMIAMSTLGMAVALVTSLVAVMVTAVHIMVAITGVMITINFGPPGLVVLLTFMCKRDTSRISPRKSSRQR